MTIPKFVWASEHQKAFDALKLALTTAPLLGYPDFDREFILETDASLRGLGAVLSQVDDLGKTHVIAYASQTLRPSERSMRNYSSAKLELLALKWAVTEKFRDYLLGSKFTVYTDNNPLAYIQTSKLGASQIRWLSELALFDFNIIYRSGKSNQAADTLSWCSWVVPGLFLFLFVCSSGAGWIMLSELLGWVRMIIERALAILQEQ